MTNGEHFVYGSGAGMPVGQGATVNRPELQDYVTLWELAHVPMIWFL